MYGSNFLAIFGFRLTCDYLALYCLFYGIFYLIIGRGWRAIMESRCNNDGIPMEIGHSRLNVSLIRLHPHENVSIDKVLNFSRIR
jgi:hypothetical protein